MKKLLPLIAILFFATTTFAQLKVTKAKITFQIKNLGINTTGFFGNMQANIQFDPANLATSSIEATTDVNSINTDNDTRDEHLRSDEFFDAAKYPKISLKSVSLKHKSGNNYSGQFNVVMKNRAKVIEVPFTYITSGNNATFKGSFKLNRIDFGVGEKSMVLSNDVTVFIEVDTEK